MRLSDVASVFIAAAFSLNMAPKTLLFNQLSFFRRAVSRIGPNIFTAVVFIKKVLKDIAVMMDAYDNIPKVEVVLNSTASEIARFTE